MNSYYPELGQVPHVVMDDRGGGRTAAREALNRGYRHLACVFKTDDRQGQERLNGFLDEIRGRGMDIPSEQILTFGTEDRMTLFDKGAGAEFARKLPGSGVDCVVCYNDVFAVSLMAILRQQGVKLPEEMGFIGFDNAVFAEMANPGLTTLGHPKEAFGALVAEKLLRMIAGQREESTSVPWTLIERDSLPRLNRP